MRAYQFAKTDSAWKLAAAMAFMRQTRAQVEQTFEQILRIAGSRPSPREDATPRAKSEDHCSDALWRGSLINYAFGEILGTLDCDLTEGRHAP